jgi:predicted nucleic acid-binding protein
MKLVVDANIIFAVLIKDSVTSVIFTSPHLELYAPEFLLAEVWRHLPLLARKTHRTAEDLIAGLLIVRERITVVPAATITAEHREASLASNDIEDAPYIALALSVDAALWTNDAR